MHVTKVVVGPIDENCYIVEHGGECIVFDPGDQLRRIVTEIRGVPVKAIVATHRHWDHVGVLEGLARETGAPVLASEKDADAIINGEAPLMRMYDEGEHVSLPRHVDRRLVDGDTIELGDRTLRVIETPGHTVGSICLYCEGDGKEPGILVAGDTLFYGGRFGRTDLETGSERDMVNTLRTKFVDIPDNTLVLTGHERTSTMEAERKWNPYLN